MTSPNHISGGIVVTGIFASFWNVNIFSNSYYIAACIFFALLPDIDHRKSLIGFIFRPVSSYLDKSFGHRTVTHSGLFLTIVVFLSMFIENMFSTSNTFTLIIGFSLLSHLILDMLTLQGIPFFYPFKRNPCVIPGNAKYRLQSRDLKTESVAFLIFIVLGFSLFPLFKNGFWTSYNRAFGTVMHVHRENNNQENFIKCEYDYTRNNKNYSGVGYVVFSKEKELTIFDGDKLINLLSDDNLTKIEYVKPVLTDVPRVYKEQGFFNITLDSLNRILLGHVVSGTIQSNRKVQLVQNNISKVTNIIKLERAFNFQILTVKDTIKKDILGKIEHNKIKLALEENIYRQKSKELQLLKSEKLKLLDLIDKLTRYEKNKLQKQLIDVNSKIEKFDLETYQVDPLLKHEIEILRNQLLSDDKTLFSGLVSYPIIKL